MLINAYIFLHSSLLVKSEIVNVMLIVLLIHLNICVMKKGRSIYEPDFLSISVTFKSLLRMIVNFISTKSLGYLVKYFID